MSDKNEGALGSMGGFVAMALGFCVARALPVELIIALIAGGLAGLLVGLIPYFVARKRNHMSLAGGAFGTCTVSGMVLGLLLAVPVCIGFVTAILVKTRGADKAAIAAEGAVGEDFEPVTIGCGVPASEVLAPPPYTIPPTRVSTAVRIQDRPTASCG